MAQQIIFIKDFELFSVMVILKHIQTRATSTRATDIFRLAKMEYMLASHLEIIYSCCFDRYGPLVFILHLSKDSILEEEMATHSSVLAEKILRTTEPSGAWWAKVRGVTKSRTGLSD